jgi:chemotaxis protein CheD
MNEPELVGIAQMVVTKAPERICCMGLGSCVAVFLYDPTTKVGGVAHVLLPRAPQGTKMLTKYANTAVGQLLADVLAKGARKEHLRAKLVGGAQMFPNLSISVSDIGKENCDEAKKALRQLGVRLAAEDTHGTRGRSATFDLETGRVSITNAFSDSRVI